MFTGHGLPYTCTRARTHAHTHTHIWEGNIILKETGSGGMDWIHQTQIRNKWHALVKTVMSLQVSKNVENLPTSYQLLKINSARCSYMG